MEEEENAFKFLILTQSFQVKFRQTIFAWHVNFLILDPVRIGDQQQHKEESGHQKGPDHDLLEGCGALLQRGERDPNRTQ